MNSEKIEKKHKIEKIKYRIFELGEIILELKLKGESRKVIRSLHIKYDELIKELKKNS